MGPAEDWHSRSTLLRFVRALVASAKLPGITFIVCFAGGSTYSASETFEVASASVQGVLRYFRTAKALAFNLLN